MPIEAPKAARRGNPLTVPLIVVSVVAAVEAITLAYLLGAVPRRRESAAHSVAAAAAADSPATSVSTAAASKDEAVPPAPPKGEPTRSAAVARGKVGHRVESAGLGMTVEKLLHEPGTYKDQVRVGPDERYLAMLLAVDNNTGGNAQLYPSQFRLQDAAGFGYDPLNLKGTMPALQWTTLGNRQTVRGYVDFVVPKSAKALELVYAGVPDGGPQIQVELGE
jgi:hypothetical protein